MATTSSSWRVTSLVVVDRGEHEHAEHVVAVGLEPGPGLVVVARRCAQAVQRGRVHGSGERGVERGIIGVAEVDPPFGPGHGATIWGSRRHTADQEDIDREHQKTRGTAATSGAGEGRGSAGRERAEPRRRPDHDVRGLDGVRVPPHALVRGVDRVPRRGVSVRAAHDDRVAGGDLLVDVRDDQPEPRRREAPGARRSSVGDRADRGEAERGSARDLEADPRADPGDPRAHDEAAGGAAYAGPAARPRDRGTRCVGAACRLLGDVRRARRRPVASTASSFVRLATV